MDTHSILATVQDLVDLAPRATGTPGGERAAAYVADRFTRAGLSDVHEMQVPSYAWRATRCHLTVDGEARDCAPILHSGLPAHDAVGTLLDAPVTAPVVDIGSGRVTDHDVAGRIVLFDLAFTMTTAHLLPLAEWIHDPGRRMLRRDVLASRNPYVTTLTRVARDAARGGAVGLVGVLKDYPESLSYHNEYYRRTLLELPGVWVTAAGGASIRASLDAAARAGRTPSATLDLAAARHEVTSRTVIGVLPGRSTETVMVQSHHDSIGPGAVEDGTGTAEVIALAEHFGARAAAGEQRDKTLLFVTFDTHFTGYQAHQEFARRYALDPDSPWDLVLNLTVEHVGLRAVASPEGDHFATTGESEPRGLFENLSPRLSWHLARGLRRHGLAGTTLLNARFLEWGRLGIPTDASFSLVSGVPVVSLISGPLYLYADADDLAKVDVDQLVPVARYFADVVDRVDAVPGSRIGWLPRSVRRRLPRGNW